MLAEGLEAVELYVLRPFQSRVKKPELHVREPVLVLTATGAYRGGLRTLPATHLDETGVKPGTEIDVRVSDDHWEIGIV